MPCARILLSAFFALLACAPLPAGAEEGTDAFAKRVFAAQALEQKNYACFARVYDAAHLARHRRQTVSGMRLLVVAEKLPEDEELNYSFTVGIKFRDRKGDFASSGACGHAQISETNGEGLQIGCAHDCGAGGIDFVLSADNTAIRAKLDEIAVWPAERPDDESAQRELRGGADDRVFRLDRVGLEACAALMKVDEALATLPRQ